jgi:hypothetical protein
MGLSKWKNQPMVTETSTVVGAGIDSIFAEIVSRGTLSPSRYEVEFTIPSSVLERAKGRLKSETKLSKKLTMSCEISNLPGRGVSTTPNRIYGPVREMPHERLYSGDLDLTFRVGKDMAERRIFELWMDSIVNKHSNDFMYFDKYKTNMMISQLDKENKKVYQMELFDVYPKTINPIEQSAATTDDYIRQSISFHFRKYEVVRLSDTLDSQSTFITKPDPPNFVEFPPPSAGVPPFLQRDSEYLGNLPEYLRR